MGRHAGELRLPIVRPLARDAPDVWKYLCPACEPIPPELTDSHGAALVALKLHWKNNQEAERKAEAAAESFRPTPYKNPRSFMPNV